jgi:hypothetical protein
MAGEVIPPGRHRRPFGECCTKDRLRDLWREDFADAVDEASSRFNGEGGALRWHNRAGAGFVVGNSFQIVGLREKDWKALSMFGSSFASLANSL